MEREQGSAARWWGVQDWKRERGQRWLPSLWNVKKAKLWNVKKTTYGFGVKRQSAETLTVMVCCPGLICVSAD